ncbi:exosome complex RNA-binding protein Csl4 [Methanotrichaceae archaeon M04Ac]|jgi:exosome complex component CSL4|uniref:Exosome complex component Csl4 n=1 Tax=Candidatus Methanocrinis alkalitolerans TaxID=3033395 RepID=A0ABT5XHF0_9EURY|nr:exosome complex RNA-binding protein Csl4 [Candidatus Methanocrinis alkalitolerans]MCR3884096.1 exosome complex RNA-binding protein Csl4 [Methanothrix sp.]MDF0594092.1 exosome complex RNA-binding protein Csl4 [Candidatus Methanocrinis alkalitolerans]
MRSNFVIPGEVVGTAEEFLPGEGTYVRGEHLRASTTGVIEVDAKNRSAKVLPRINAPVTLRNGDVVVGQITDLKESLAILRLAFKRGCEERPIHNSEALIHISRVKNSYVKDIRSVLGLRDIIKAKIIDDTPTIGLSIVDGDLGVVKAYCGRCATPLRIEGDRLVCPDCGQVESRKLSTDFGTGVIR